MSNKKVVIVGSGVAGITAAYFEAKKGGQIILIDSDSRAGGLLKSDFINDRYYDYGTHIFSGTGVSELDDFLFSGLNNDNCVITNNIHADNYFNDEMNNKNCYADSSTIEKHLFHQGCVELLASEVNPQTDNLEEFLLQKFGKVFYQEIYKPVIEKYISIEPKELAVQMGNFFDMSRLLAFNDQTTQRLGKLDVYDSKLGHHTRVDGVIKYYPRNGGVGKVIDLLIDKLKEQNVDVKLSTNIESVVQDDGKVISLITEDEEIVVDKLIWTLSSSFLTYLSGLDKNSPPPQFRNTGLYDFTFEKPLDSTAAFINVYDVNLYSGRVTLYQNLSQTNNYSCTVEVLADDNVDLNKLIDKVQDELVKMGVVCENNRCTFKQYRPIKNGFPVLTNAFVKAQNELSDYCCDYFKNVLFVGRSTGKVFFMGEVLIDTYQKIAND